MVSSTGTYSNSALRLCLAIRGSYPQYATDNVSSISPIGSVEQQLNAILDDYHLDIREAIESFAVMDAHGNLHTIPKYAVVHSFSDSSSVKSLVNGREFASFIHLRTRYYARRDAIAVKTKLITISPPELADERDC